VAASDGSISVTRLVGIEFLVGHDVAPPTIRPLIEERLGAADETAFEWSDLVGASLHPRERAALDHPGQLRLVDLDGKEGSDPAHLPFEVGGHVVVVDEQEVRFAAPFPERRDVFQEPGVLEPPREERVLVVDIRQAARAEVDAFPRGTHGEIRRDVLPHAPHVVVHRHEDVAPVAVHRDVRRVRDHGIPSAGVCVLSARRCVCASRRSSNTSTGSKRASSHGAITITGPGAPSGNISVFTIVCIHVVPHLEGVHTNTSPGRGTKFCHRRLSETIVRYSRTRENVYAGGPAWMSAHIAR
jgi:hypothetical protein